jgi:hypothetical protein
VATKKIKKERRRHKRSKIPDIVLSIDGKQYLTRNLSIGGSLIGGYDGPLSAGALFTVTGIGPEGGEMEEVEIRARVNRAGAGNLALTFLEINISAYEILQDVMAKSIEGLEATVKSDPAGPVPDQD